MSWSKTARLLEFLVSFGLAYLFEGLTGESVRAFCQGQSYPVLVACLYLGNPVFLIFLAFLVVAGGIELAKSGIGKMVKGWLTS